MVHLVGSLNAELSTHGLTVWFIEETDGAIYLQF